MIFPVVQKPCPTTSDKATYLTLLKCLGDDGPGLWGGWAKAFYVQPTCTPAQRTGRGRNRTASSSPAELAITRSVLLLQVLMLA